MLTNWWSFNQAWHDGLLVELTVEVVGAEEVVVRKERQLPLDVVGVGVYIVVANGKLLNKGRAAHDNATQVDGGAIV